MKSLVLAAAIQMQSSTNVADNLATAERLLAEAAKQGAELAVLPELFPCLGTYAETAAAAQPLDGSLSQQFARWAQQFQLTLVAGSMSARAEASSHCYNTSLLYDATGERVAEYRKVHLFDVELPDGKSLHESAHFAPGDRSVVAHTSLGNVGLAICYDLRFPELFRQLSAQQAELICLPAAFTSSTGAVHWHTLVKARAIENQSFVIAANQVGEHSESLHTYGHSMIVDPWGDVLAEASGEAEEVILAELSADRLRSVREKFPALAHRRL